MYSSEVTLDTIVWTDNRSAVVMARCVNGKRRNWKVVTTESTMEVGVEEKAKSIVEGLGFNTTFISYRL